MIRNILTIDHHPTHNHHVEAITEEKDPSHSPLVCSRGQQSKASRSRLSPLYYPYKQNSKRETLG